MGLRPRAAALVLVGLTGWGCNSDQETPGYSSGAGGSGSNGTGSTSSGAGTSGGVEPKVVTRVARLTHDQYDATVQDLFGIEDSPAEAFPPDALNGFDFDTSIDFEVDARLGPQYRSAAEALAQRAVSDTEVFDRIVSCDVDEAGCAEEFIESFGQRAFRRPLTEDEQTRFSELFQRGPELVASGDDFRDGVELVVEAMLQSPQFLYRTELSEDVDDGLVLLNSWELASRLSYFIHGSMPTTELFERAASGELDSTEQIHGAVTELLEEARATPHLVSFYAQAWDFSRFSRIAPDTDTYPDVPDQLVSRVQASSERFVARVIDSGGGLAEFLTAPYAYVDSELAPLYGERVDDSGFVRIDLDPEARKGFLMQVGFLASHAYAIKTDPIHRGLFVVREVLCQNIPDPPPGASMTEPPQTTEPIETTRQEIELLTGQRGCEQCHSQINPAGFAFEGFDAVGGVRERENDVEVDTSGILLMDGEELAFSGAVELVDALAQSPEARACHVRKFLEFGYGRALSSSESPMVEALSESALSVKELVAEVSTTPAFVARQPNEVAP